LSRAEHLGRGLRSLTQLGYRSSTRVNLLDHVSVLPFAAFREWTWILGTILLGSSMFNPLDAGRDSADVLLSSLPQLSTLERSSERQMSRRRAASELPGTRRRSVSVGLVVVVRTSGTTGSGRRVPAPNQDVSTPCLSRGVALRHDAPRSSGTCSRAPPPHARTRAAKTIRGSCGTIRRLATARAPYTVGGYHRRIDAHSRLSPFERDDWTAVALASECRPGRNLASNLLHRLRSRTPPAELFFELSLPAPTPPPQQTKPTNHTH